MVALENISYEIKDLTDQNLSLNELGLKNYHLPDDNFCAQITVRWHEAKVSDETIGLFFALHFVAILFHEWGHILALKYYYRQENVLAKFGLINNRPKIWTGAEWQYSGLAPRERVVVYLSGIVMGLFPIFAGILINPFLMLNLPFYAWGCIQDAKLIRLNIQGEEKVKKQNEQIKQWFSDLVKTKSKKAK